MSGVIRSVRVRKRIVHWPVRWIISVTTLGSRAPVNARQAIQRAGTKSPANTAALSGENRPLRSLQGALSFLMTMNPTLESRRFKPRHEYYEQEPADVSAPAVISGRAPASPALSR